MIRQKGMALVLVLWVLSLLTIMAGSFALSMRRESSIIAGIKNNAQAKAIAESGIAMAEIMLLNPDPAKGWRTDGSIYEINSADAKIRVRLSSETGKIDINKADETLLKGLMTSAPVDEDQQTKVVNAILDWRDEDDLVHIEGAEKQEYQDAGLSYQPGNKPFQSIEELQLVLGMDKSLFLWIEPLVTVYSGQPQVTIQDATKEVLLVIPGLDRGLVDSYIAARVESAINNLPAPPFPSSSEMNTPTRQNIPTGQSNVLTVVSEAVLDDKSRASVSAVIKKSGNSQAIPFEVLKWQHVSANSASLFTDAMSKLLVAQYAEPELNN
ncbi:MAG: general secretion pathway protein GspK [Methylococcaceae bacterium]|nr:general secretion pathway protein GspK [Methylococcaceae bacterium]